MIELEDLKNIWKDRIEPDVQQQRLQQQAIREMLKYRSQDIMERLRRNLLMEMVMFVVCLLLIAAVPFYFRYPQVTLLCGIVLAVVFVPYFVYYLKKYLELRRYFSYHEDMRTNLQQLIVQLEKYLNIYFWGSLLLTPISGFLSGYAILYQMKALGYLVYFDAFSSATLSMILSFALLLTLISYPVMKWYIRKLYGQHLEKLKGCLQELQEVE